MYNLNQEQIKLAEQNESRLFYFINLHIHKLNQILKCSICFELYHNPVTISNCLHVFCKDCIETYLEYLNVKESLCPVCRKPFLKDELIPNNFLTSVMKFVSIVKDKLNAIYQDDVSNLLSLEAILQNFKNVNEIQSRVDEPIQLDTSSPALTVLLNAKKVLIGLDDNAISTVEQLPPMQSIDFRDGSVKTPIFKKRKTVVTPVTKPSAKDKFDILKESPIENPLFKSTPKSYLKKDSVQKDNFQTKNQNVKNSHSKVVPFEDDANRINVIKWLQNSQNKFDQIPKTQEKIDTNGYEADFDMPSVSQRHKSTNSPVHVPLTSCINKQKQEQNKIRKRNDIISRLNTKRNIIQQQNPRRTRSLENSVKTVKKHTDIKRHSVSILENLGENLNIEQFSSDEVRFSLSQADNEVNKENLDGFQTVITSRKRGNSKVDKSDTTGWRRIKAFKKAIKKTERKPGKLRLTGVSRTSGASKGSNRSDKTNKQKNNEPIVVLNRMNFNDTASKANDKQNMSRIYDLNILESYISDNINKLTNISMLEENKPVNTKSPIKEQPCVVENLQKETVSDQNKQKQVLYNNTPTISSDNKENNFKLESIKKSRKRLFNDDSKNNTDLLIKENDLPLEKTVKTNKILTEPNQSIKQNQEIITNETKHFTEKYVTNHDNLNVEPPINNKEILQSDHPEDEFYLEPTQKLVENQNIQKPDVSEDDDIFKIATQIIPNSPNDLLQRKLQSLDALIQDLSVISIGKIRSDLIKILKVAYESISATQEQSLMLDVQVQTSNPKDQSLFSQNATTQTATLCLSFKNIGIQTDICSSPGGFRISSTELFKTQAVVSTKIQTDALECPKCNYLIGDCPDSVSSTSLINKTNEKYILTESFDNFNFETQDVLKGRVIKDSSLNEEKMDEDNSNLKSFKDINEVKPEVSLKDSNISYIKPKTWNELAMETTQKTNKRIRNPSVESDIDKVEKSPKKCKFIDEDISIQFVSQLDEDINLSQNKNSENTESEECMNNILKKNEENQSVTKKTLLPSYTKQQNTEDLIKECEKIIEEACSEVIIIERPQKHSVNLNNGNTPESSKLTLAVLEEEFQNNFSGDGKKDLKKGEDTKNKLSETLFTSNYQLSKAICGTNQTPEPNKNANLLVSDDLLETDYEFNTFFENNPTVKQNVNMKNNEIKILQDITLKPNDNGVHLKINEIKRKDVELNDDEESVKSDDMFLSDSDVVDTTPEKKEPVSLEKLTLLSQAYFIPESEPILAQEHLNTKDSLPLSCLNEVFLPPQGFQDTEDVKIISNTNSENTNKIDEIRVKPNLSSLTPDGLMVPLNIEITDDSPQKKSSLITSTPYSHRSQVISVKSLNISPIKEEETDSTGIRNPILAAQNSKSSPLTIVCSKALSPQRLPTGISKQKSILKYIKPIENINRNIVKRNITQSLEIDTTVIKKKPCVACTRMNEYELMSIISLANKKMITYSAVFTSTITHMIVDVDDKNRVKDHTMKFVCAVASGIWVLNFKWVQECLKENCIVEEEPFEALDLSGIDGPKQARLSRLTNPLLKNYKIHAASPFLSTTQKEVENVITLLGGEVVPRPDDLLANDGKIKLIITEAKGSDDFDLYESWVENLKVITVDLEWLSRCIGQYKISSLKHYTLCSGDNFEDLGYPEELLLELPFSCT